VKAIHEENPKMVFENFPANMLNNLENLQYCLPGPLMAARMDSCDENEALEIYEKMKDLENATIIFHHMSFYFGNGGILRFVSIENISEWLFRMLEMCGYKSSMRSFHTFCYFMKAVLLRNEADFAEMAERIKPKLMLNPILFQEDYWSFLDEDLRSKISIGNFLTFSNMMFAIAAAKLEEFKLQGREEDMDTASYILSQLIFRRNLQCPTKKVLGIMLEMNEDPRISDAFLQGKARCAFYKFLFIENPNEIVVKACRAFIEELPPDAVMPLDLLKYGLHAMMAAFENSSE
jgi:hypothetical protein